MECVVKVHFQYNLNQKQKDEWSEFLLHCKHSHAQQDVLWGEVVRAHGRIPIYMYAKENNGSMISVGVFSIKHHWLFNNYSIDVICSRGPAIDNIEYFDELLTQIIKFFNSIKVGIIRISPYWYYPEAHTEEKQINNFDKANELESKLQDFGFIPYTVNSAIRNKIVGYNVSPQIKTCLIDIQKSEDEILASFSKKTRSHIKKYRKSNVEIRRIDNVENVREFYDQYSSMCLEKCINTEGEEAFIALYNNLLANGDTGILNNAYLDGEFIGGLWAIRSSYYAQGCRLVINRNKLKEKRCGNNFSVSVALNWETMLWAKIKGCKYWDLEGEAEKVDKSHHMYGVFKHKLEYNPIHAARIHEHVHVCNSLLNNVHEGQKIYKKISNKIKSCF